MDAQPSCGFGGAESLVEEAAGLQPSLLQLVEIAFDAFGITHAPKPLTRLHQCHYILQKSIGGGAAYVFTNICPICPRPLLVRDGSGGYFIRFNGTPGAPYRLQRASGFAGPWNTITTLAPPPSGHFEYHDTPPPGQSFYRTVQP